MALIITYDKLKQVLTEEQGFNYIKQLAQTFKFPATSFLSGSIGYTLLKIQGAILAIISDSVSEISKQIYLDESSGSYLTLLADNFFDITRYGETQSVINVNIKTEGATPHPYDAESVKISISGIEYYNSEAFSVEADGYVVVEFTSTEYGADTRVATNVMPIFTQNVIGNATFSLIDNENGYFIIISNGQNEETDDDLKIRCRSKWGTLSTLGPEDAYRYWIMSAINPNTQGRVDITRIKIDRSGAQLVGNLVIYCANDTGPASAEDIAAAAAVVDQNRAICSRVFVDPAIASTFIYNLTVTVNSTAEPSNELLTQSIAAAIRSYFSSLDVGGAILNENYKGYVIYSKIVDLIMNIQGVENVTLGDLYVDDVLQTTQDIQIDIYTVAVLDANETDYIIIERV
jgi:phage-related baseplate assembly protein